MHIFSVIHLLSFLLMFLAAAMLLPLPFSWYYGSGDGLALLTSAFMTALFGLIGYLTTRFKKQELRAREGFAIVTFGWIIFSLFGSLPFMISGSIPSFTDAFYETMSGFTTTGSTILTDIEAVPEGVLLWRSLTHWIGGMGIIVLSLAILPFLGVGGMQLFKAEVPGPVADKLTPRVTETAKILWGVYVLFTAVQLLLLMLGGMSFFDALNHALATLATGGYSTQNTSVAAYDSLYIDSVIMLFMFIAGTNFAFHYKFLRGDFGVYFRNKEFMTFVAIVSIATLLIGFDTYFNQYGNIVETVQYSLFQVLAITTTTGFGTADYEQWSTSSQAILFMLMFMGGCAGSTSGGMKVMRLYLLAKFTFREITHLIHPHAVMPIRMNNAVVPREVMLNIVGYFILFMGIFAVSVLLMAGMGLDFESALGAVASNMGNIGPGLGSVGPTDNYAHVPDAGKWLLCFLMLLGRLEVFTVIVLFSPAYWRK